MPVKLLLADKSITIQKVVEMLFSGREYEVVCVSDGETALNEAARVVPDVILADVDLPRIDGYSFAAKLKQTPNLAQTPVILMMSRDDVYDAAKGKQSGIFDHIAKPFESQELIGKVKKSLASAPPRLTEPQPPAATPAPPAASVPKPIAPPKPAPPKKPAAPVDIFDIISEAPTPVDVKQAAAHDDDDTVYEVEPVFEEVDAPLGRDVEKALPVGAKAVEEMRAGLGLGESEEPQPEIVTFESLKMAMDTGKAPSPAAAPPRADQPQIAAPRPSAPPEPPPSSFPEPSVPGVAKDAAAKMPAPMPTESEMWHLAEETIARMAKDMFAQINPAQLASLQPAPAQVSDEKLRGMVEAAVSRMSNSLPVAQGEAPAIPKISEDTVRRGIENAVNQIAREIAREVIEKVAWEVIPQLAEVMIREEIERLKAEP